MASTDRGDAPFTVLGCAGFIGSALVEHLRRSGHETYAPEQVDERLFARPLGHLLFSIGVTADFRERPYDTARAHVGVLADVLERAEFESLLYLSSTRVYAGSDSGSESASLRVSPLVADDLYNLTKLTGECLCFASERQRVRVARLSNVYGVDSGSDNLLPSLIRDAIDDGRIVFRGHPSDVRDFVSLDDVAELLPRIAASGRDRIYNVASGENRSNAELADALASATGCTVEFQADAPTVSFPAIEIGRIREEFGANLRGFPEDLSELVERFRNTQ